MVQVHPSRTPGSSSEDRATVLFNDYGFPTTILWESGEVGESHLTVNQAPSGLVCSNQTSLTNTVKRVCRLHRLLNLVRVQ